MNDKLFGEGWMTEHLDEVLDEMSQIDERFWPRLTGERAQHQDAMNDMLRKRRGEVNQ